MNSNWAKHPIQAAHRSKTRFQSPMLWEFSGVDWKSKSNLSGLIGKISLLVAPSKDRKDPPRLQFISVVQSYLILYDPMNRSTPGLSITNCQNLPKPMSIESVMPSNHLISCHMFLLPPSIFPSIRGFSSESAFCIRRPKYWSFSFGITDSMDMSLSKLWDILKNREQNLVCCSSCDCREDVT